MNTNVLNEVVNAGDLIAAQNRAFFRQNHVYVVNVLGSSGAGKTEAISKAIACLKPNINAAVIAGDLCTDKDSNRLAENNIPTIQVNTQGMDPHCYLAPEAINKAASGLDLKAIDVLFIENLGNMICPSEHDIGENEKMIVLSVTEGEDIPLKNTMVFKQCQTVVLNKTDLLPHLEYDTAKARKNVLCVNPEATVFEISAKTGEGAALWSEAIEEKINTNRV